MVIVTFNDSENEILEQTIEWLKSQISSDVSAYDFVEKEINSSKNGLIIDENSRIVTLNNKKIYLNHLEFDTLCYLHSHPNQVLSNQKKR